MADKPKKLKPQHQKFVEELAKGKSQTDAYKKAYPTVKSRKVAQAASSRLLSNVIISEAAQHRINLALANAKTTPEEVLGSAVRQMRSSIRDVLDDNGSFSLEKADEMGAIDLVKKHKETIKIDMQGNTTKTIEIEMLTNQDGRKEVASYLGLDHFANSGKQNADITLMRELLYALVKFHNYSIEVAIAGVKEQFPHLDGEIIEIEAKDLKESV